MISLRFLGTAFCLLILHLPKSAAQVHYIRDDFKTERDTVHQYGKNATLNIEIDSVYLLNQTQFDYYALLMRLKVDVKKNNANIEGLINGLLKSLSNDLSQLESLNKAMKANGDAASDVGMRLADSTKANVSKTNSLLDSVKINLDSASVRLKRADLHLEKAEALIKKEKKRRWRYYLVGGGVGFLVGILAKLIKF